MIQLKSPLLDPYNPVGEGERPGKRITMWCDEGNETSLEGHCGLTEKEDLIGRLGVDLRRLL